jgi:3-methyladenine DNA glycosylase/8-oxoguanine DNA glycosylase
MPSRRLQPPEPFDLKRTLAAAGIQVRDGVGWWATRTHLGPATLSIHSAGNTLVAETWGPGADDLLARVPRVLGFDDDPEAFPAGSGLVRDLHRRALGTRLGSTGAMFEAIVPAVLGQKVTGAEAKRSERRLRAALAGPRPGPTPGLPIPPAPGAIAALGYEDLHGFGIERKRAQVLIECARRARRIEEALDMEVADAWGRLMAIRGVGPWTAGIVMGTAYGDRDAVLVGDYNLPSLVTWALAGRARGTDEEMLELLEPYRPYRRRAMMLLKRSGIDPPKYGPRRAVRTHL